MGSKIRRTNGDIEALAHARRALKKKQYNTLEEQNGSRVVVAGCSTMTEENAIT